LYEYYVIKTKITIRNYTMVYGDTITLNTKGYSDIKNITGEVQNIIRKSGLQSGIINISVIGSTASVSTIEYEPALVEDVKELLDDLVPSTMHSRHSQTWGDDNGFSHMRATIMGPGITIPFNNGSAILGTWQQIIVLDHDNRPRTRKIYIQVIGE
jgi:secondary thiamine-phosphate synthase enzyme